MKEEPTSPSVNRTEAEKEEEAKLGHSIRDVLTCSYYLESGIAFLFSSPEPELK